MFSLWTSYIWPPIQSDLQRLQPLSQEKISSRARPRAVVLLSSEPRTTGEIITLCKLVVKTRRVTQSRALHYVKKKMRDCSKSILKHANKQLLDEVEHDIMNYQNRGLCYLPKPKAEAITQTRGFDNSWNHAKTEFNNCFIIHFSHNSSSETEAKRSAILFLRRTLQRA